MKKNFTFFLTVLCMSFAASTAHTQTCTWLGGNGNWNNPSGWSCGVVPGPLTDVVINSGTVTGSLFQDGIPPDTVIIKSLTLNGGNLTTGSHLIIEKNFNWINGTLAGTPNLSAGYNGYSMVVRGRFNIHGNNSVPTLTLVGKQLIANGGGVWNNPPNVMLMNGSISFMENPFALELIINCNSRNAEIQHYETEVYHVRPVFSSSTGIIKNGRFDFKFGPQTLYLSNSFLQINQGNVEINPRRGSSVSGEYISVNNNCRLHIIHREGIVWVSSSVFANTQIISQGTVQINDYGSSWESRFAMIGNSVINTDTLLCYNQRTETWDGVDFSGSTVLGGNLVCNYFELPQGIFALSNASADVFRTGNGVCFSVENTFTINDARISGGALGGGGKIIVNDTLLLTESSTYMKLAGIHLLINGYGKMKTFGIPVTNGIDFFSLFIPRNSSIEIAPGKLLEMEISGNSTIIKGGNHPDGEAEPYTAEFINKGTLNIYSSTPLPDCNLNLSVINSGNIFLANVKLNIDELTWQNGGEIRGRADVNIAGNFNFSGNGQTAKLNTSKIYLSGNSVFANGTIDINRYGGIALNNGGKITACSNGPVTITNSTGDGRGYFSNYGSFVKAYGPHVFHSDVLLKNGRDMLIYGGTVKPEAGFINLNMVRGFGTLDLSTADLVTNTGTFSGGGSLTGVLTILGDFDNNNLLVDIKGDNPAAGPPNDNLVVSGHIYIAGSKLTVQERGLAPADTSYIIMECAGGPDCVSGQFSILDMPAGYSVIYTGNQVILQKGMGMRIAAMSRGPVDDHNKEDNSLHTTFKVYKISEGLYRIETTRPDSEIDFMDMSGKLVKQLKLNALISVENLTGLAKGVYVAYNKTTREKLKFVIY